ncbi:MAG: YdcF family protein [Rickettsiales bacterium]|nr:YdcF family protein [Rickettsiales bacterium]
MQIEEFHHIQAKMLPKTELKHADLLIVFGTTYGIDLFVENIVNLYQKGFCKYILCTGGNVAMYGTKTEAESVIIMDLLVENGVPADKILVETTSKNTGENLQFSLPILEEKFGRIDDIKSIMGLGKIHATLRFLMTMCKYFPDAEKMFFSINVFGCDENLWYLHDNFHQKLMAEVDKVDKYLKKDFIAELDETILFIK